MNTSVTDSQIHVNHGTPAAPHDAEAQALLERGFALERATEIALSFDVINGTPNDAPLKAFTPIDPDAFARWAIRKCAHLDDDNKRAGLLIAAGFVMMHVPQDARSDVAEAIAWPAICDDYMHAAKHCLSKHDFEIVAQWNTNGVIGEVMRAAHAAAPELFEGTSIVGFAVVGEAVLS